MQRGRSRPETASTSYTSGRCDRIHQVTVTCLLRRLSVATGERSGKCQQRVRNKRHPSHIISLMRDLNRHRDAIRRLKKKLRLGDSTASNNIAIAYRELGDFRRAFQWWRRTAGPKDGDAWLEVGYCLQYGIGRFAVAVESWHVGSAVRPTARCTAAPACDVLGRLERTAPTPWSRPEHCRRMASKGCAARTCSGA